MSALNTDRHTLAREGMTHVDPVAASTTIYAGGIVMLDANGNAVPATAATGLTARGRAEHRVANAGSAGDATVRSRAGTFCWANAGDIDRTHIGANAYAVDDQTVSADPDLDEGSPTRSVVGRIDDLTADGVWVTIPA
jgi:hypothetical protein